MTTINVLSYSSDQMKLSCTLGLILKLQLHLNLIQWF